MHILEDVGVHFRDPVALDGWRRVRAKVVVELVFSDRGLVRDLIASVPADFTYHARDPAKSARISDTATWAGGPSKQSCHSSVKKVKRTYRLFVEAV